MACLDDSTRDDYGERDNPLMKLEDVQVDELQMSQVSQTSHPSHDGSDLVKEDRERVSTGNTEPPPPPSPQLVSAEEEQTTRRYLLFVATAAALTGGTLGYDVGIMAAALIGLDEDFDLTDEQKEIVVGSLNFVAAFGALAAGVTAGWLGRKKTLALCSFLYLLGTAMMTCAPDYAWLLAGRIITGVGVGISFVVAPTYNSEVSPKEVRGRIGTIFDISINVGILAGYVVGFACEEMIPDGVAKWRAMFGIGALFPLAVAGMLLYLPESPRWLLQQGRTAEAEVVLRRFLPSDAAVRESVDDIQRDDNLETPSWAEVVCPPEAHLKRTLGIAYGLAFWQQITGSEAILYYSATILEDAGLESKTMLLLGNLLVGSSKLLPEFWAMSSIDKRGRRWHLVASSAAMTAAISLIALSFALELPSYTVVVLLCVFMATFSIGLGPFSFTTATEILPLTHRAKGMSVVTFINRIVSAAVSLSALSLSTYMGMGWYFFAYSVVSLISIRFFMRNVPETTGKSLETIAEELRQHEGGGPCLMLSTCCIPPP
ncbi:putative polyol transporter 4 [Diplonema papillatum]|nr:putative polyol transporter 4 [Diplonema papillatum]